MKQPIKAVIYCRVALPDQLLLNDASRIRRKYGEPYALFENLAIAKWWSPFIFRQMEMILPIRRVFLNGPLTSGR